MCDVGESCSGALVGTVLILGSGVLGQLRKLMKDVRTEKKPKQKKTVEVKANILV